MPTHILSADDLRQRRPGQTFEDHIDAVRTARDEHGAAVTAVRRTTPTSVLNAEQQRALDRHIEQRRQLNSLVDELVASPEGQSVDHSVPIMSLPTAGVSWANPDGTATRSAGPDTRTRVLGPEQRVADWAQARSQHRPEHDSLSMGAMLRGWVTGRWDDADREQRALLEGTQAGGGVLVPTPLSTELIDRARNVSRCFQAGARVVPMDTQTLKVPRIAGSPTPAWRAENAAVVEGDLTFDAITFTAKSLALMVKASRELIEDGRDVDNIVMTDLAAQVATELDRVMLRGTGVTPEPRGIRNTSGVTITAFGGANGAAPTNYDHLLDAMQVLRGGNYEPNAAIHSPRTATGLAKLKDSQLAYLAPPVQLTDMRMLTTNQIPTNLTTGTSTDTSEIYVGDFTKLWLGLRTQVTFTLAERFADFGQVAFMVWVRADVQLAQPGAFNVLTGVR